MLGAPAEDFGVEARDTVDVGGRDFSPGYDIVLRVLVVEVEGEVEKATYFRNSGLLSGGLGRHCWLLSSLMV